MNKKEMIPAIDSTIDWLETLMSTKYSEDALRCANLLYDVASELKEQVKQESRYLRSLLINS